MWTRSQEKCDARHVHVMYMSCMYVCIHECVHCRRYTVGLKVETYQYLRYMYQYYHCVDLVEGEQDLC
jgi:hypothetical protein